VATAKATALAAEIRKRQAFPRAIAQIEASLFPIQRALAMSPHKRKVTDAGRRSGKTSGAAAAAFVAAAKFPNSTVPVFEQTLQCEASDTFWELLQSLDEQYGVGCTFHQTKRACTLPNGSEIALLGAYTIEAADKHRGGKFPLAIVDEAGTFRDKVLDYLLTDVVEPATIDYDGSIIVCGTPGFVPAGPFYEMTQPGSGWEHHHWTLLDNPTLFSEGDPIERLARANKWLSDFRARKKWDESSPRYLREYMGVWTSGRDDQIYALDRMRNIIEKLPEKGKWTYALSMDLGFNDPTAFVVWARRKDDPHMYVVESYEQEGLIPSAVAAHVERLRSRYVFKSIVADTGGYGKAVAEEMKQRYGIPVQGAKKRDKRIYLEHTGGDIKAGRIKIVRRSNEALIDDLYRLGWNEDQDDVAENSRDHLPDAFLYGHREINAWWTGGIVEGPTVGSDEWFLAQEEKMERAIDKRHARSRAREHNPYGDDDTDAWKADLLGGDDDYDDELVDDD
jgi:hypothetical protein